MSLPTEVTVPSPRTYTMEEMFGENSGLAEQVLRCQEQAVMLAKTVGDVRRITRMAQTKLNSLRNIGYSRDKM